ncbi:MAG: class I SAM-dependent methyltransferase [Blastocatellia bacterium]|nr:class I SAM-dependent methyltransferase [Blastocatellia bacterium]
MSKTSKELAYIYDLFIAPTWRDCFDQLFTEKIGVPKLGRVLEVNCGTGGLAIEMATSLAAQGDVTAVDCSSEMIEIAQAKASISKIKNISFLVSPPSKLSFYSNSFDLIICDVSLTETSEIVPQLAEMVRLARPGGRVVLFTTTKGSFDEFFSIFWEALYSCSLDERLLAGLEELINERFSVSEGEQMMKQAGLSSVKTFLKKEEFTFETAEDFFKAPLIEIYLLEKWFSILPKQNRASVRAALEKIIERERGSFQFDLSIKATLLAGSKPE